ncbi:MAG TPA: twin-arginine translocase subunit TatC [Pyrinomonadaceae bacterium]|nr:twin-arginine translocase subunit TatC [Pyrinomonadaceae bacterium]
MSTLLRPFAARKKSEEELGGQMSFLAHLDELRSRLIRSLLFVVVAAAVCWVFSDRIYAFLAIPVEQALAEAQRRQVPIKGLTGNERILPLDTVQKDDVGRYIFPEETTIGAIVIPVGVSVQARVASDAEGKLALFTDEPIYAGNTIIPKGVRLVDLATLPQAYSGITNKLIVTSAMEPFSLYVKVSLYAAICLSVPFLLWQIWAFVSPGLYPHERAYVTPFIALSTISFVLGAAFAYKILFPPAARYLLGLGQDFRLLLKANDYFDFIIIVMLGMGIVFQMPAVTYVLARIGLVTARFLIKVWKTALIIILVAAAFISPSADIPNMLLFAAPMVVLYLCSILVAWIFGKPRTAIQP